MAYLKECPFCGGEPEHLYYGKNDEFPGHAVQCTDCLIETQPHKTYVDCVEVWNNRVKKSGSQ